MTSDACAVCHAQITSRRTSRQVTCGSTACKAEHRRLAQKKRFERWYSENADAHSKRVIAARKRRVDAAAENTDVSAGIDLPDYIPGLTTPLDITVDGRVSGAIVHEHARGLHAMMTALLGRPHNAGHPDFSLLQVHESASASGWAAHIWDADTARSMIGKRCEGHIGRCRSTVSAGLMYRMRSPRIASITGGSALCLKVQRSVYSPRSGNKGSCSGARGTSDIGALAGPDGCVVPLGVRWAGIGLDTSRMNPRPLGNAREGEEGCG